MMLPNCRSTLAVLCYISSINAWELQKQQRACSETDAAHTARKYQTGATVWPLSKFARRHVALLLH